MIELDTDEKMTTNNKYLVKNFEWYADQIFELAIDEKRSIDNHNFIESQHS